MGSDEHSTEDRAAAYLVLDEVMATMLRLGFVDDQRYVSSKVRSLSRRGVSRQGIVFRLSAKGVERALIEAAIADQNENVGNLELRAACIFARKRRIGPFRRRESNPDLQRRELARMARAGFSFRLAAQVMALRTPEAVEALLSAPG